jgi:nucleotide-binding universal stress UspA family protein
MNDATNDPAREFGDPTAIQFDTLCIATDFSEPAALAIEYAVAIAKRFSATTHLLHVLHELGPGIPTADYTACCDAAHSYFNGSAAPLAADKSAGFGPIEQFLASLKSQTCDRLQGLIDASPFAGLPVVTAVRYGHPVEQICRYAVENAVDLLLLGAHGRTRTEHFMMGSIAERVVRVSPCPVLTVRRRGPRAPEGGANERATVGAGRDPPAFRR